MGAARGGLKPLTAVSLTGFRRARSHNYGASRQWLEKLVARFEAGRLNRGRAAAE
jgi:hypothetical protein